MTIKIIEDPCCKKCGGSVYYAIPEIHYHRFQCKKDTEDGAIEDIDLVSLEDTVDHGDSYFYCDGCGDITKDDIIDESEWRKEEDK